MMASEEELFGEIDLGQPEPAAPLAGTHEQPRRRRDSAGRAETPKQQRKAQAAGRVINPDASRQNRAAMMQRQSQQGGQQPPADLFAQQPQQAPQLQRTTRSQRQAARAGAAPEHQEQQTGLPGRGRRERQERIPEETAPSRNGPIAALRSLFASLQGEQASVVYERFMMWLYTHPFVLILAGVLMIAVGLLVNRYISFASAVVFLVLGWLMNRDEEKDPLVCYGVAFAVFLIPYFF